MLHRTLLPTALFLGVASLGTAQTNLNSQPSGPIDYATARFERTLRSARTTSRIVLGGRLDEVAWERAEPATNFIQVQPRTGPHYDTEFTWLEPVVQRKLRIQTQLPSDGSLDYTVADLPSGDFETTLVGVSAFYGFNTNTFLNAFVQYNATTRPFSSNTRFNLIHRPLSDLFVVYNERRDTLSHAVIDRALIVKFTNLFDF